MMVAAEEGISILPDYCTDKLYNADNLVFIPLAGEDEDEEIIAAWQNSNENPDDLFQIGCIGLTITQLFGYIRKNSVT